MTKKITDHTGTFIIGHGGCRIYDDKPINYVGPISRTVSGKYVIPSIKQLTQGRSW